MDDVPLKPSLLVGCSIVNPAFWGYPQFGKPHETSRTWAEQQRTNHSGFSQQHSATRLTTDNPGYHTRKLDMVGWGKFLFQQICKVYCWWNNIMTYTNHPFVDGELYPIVQLHICNHKMAAKHETAKNLGNSLMSPGKALENPSGGGMLTVA